jgi:hypothetical protein
MRLFRYLDSTGALLTIEHKALRVSRLHELNDPFEWRIGATDLEEGAEQLGEAVTEASLRDMSSTVGVICYSAVPDEPVLWSHYADRHRGMVLEIEAPDDPSVTVQVRYTDERPHIEAARIFDEAHVRPAVEKLIRQKSKGWSYEQEYRQYVLLAGCDARAGHYYQKLEQGALKRVIVGWRSNSDIQYIQRALVLAGLSTVCVVQASIRNDTYKVRC